MVASICRPLTKVPASVGSSAKVSHYQATWLLARDPVLSPVNSLRARAGDNAVILAPRVPACDPFAPCVQVVSALGLGRTRAGRRCWQNCGLWIAEFGDLLHSWAATACD